VKAVVEVEAEAEGPQYPPRRPAAAIVLPDRRGLAASDFDRLSAIGYRLLFAWRRARNCSNLARGKGPRGGGPLSLSCIDVARIQGD
jgi:hypothetical protein